MSNYYQAIKEADVKILDKVLEEALSYFNNELVEAKTEIVIKGKTLVECCSIMSSYQEKRGEQLNELNAILSFFEQKLKVIKAKVYKNYLECYQRQLSASDIRIYVDGDENVSIIQSKINDIVLVKNNFEKLYDAFCTLNFQLTNLSKVYSANVADVIL